MPVMHAGPNGEPEHEQESVNPPLGFSKFQKVKICRKIPSPTYIIVTAVDTGGEHFHLCQCLRKGCSRQQ